MRRYVFQILSVALVIVFQTTHISAKQAMVAGLMRYRGVPATGACCSIAYMYAPSNDMPVGSMNSRPGGP